MTAAVLKFKIAISWICIQQRYYAIYRQTLHHTGKAVAEASLVQDQSRKLSVEGALVSNSAHQYSVHSAGQLKFRLPVSCMSASNILHDDIKDAVDEICSTQDIR